MTTTPDPVGAASAARPTDVAGWRYRYPSVDHTDGIQDSGDGYTLHSRVYVVRCYWCEWYGMSPTKVGALTLYDEHERLMLDEEQRVRARPRGAAVTTPDPVGDVLVEVPLALLRDLAALVGGYTTRGGMWIDRDRVKREAFALLYRADPPPDWTPDV